MIGIGVTSYNRPYHLELWTEQIKKHLPEGAMLYVAMDEPQRGIAYRKNECLRELKDCDYIFLFDDDCFPIKDGWAEFFIEASKASGQHHFNYLIETPTIKKTVRAEINVYNNCAGCMMFLTKEVIEKVGAYNHDYGIYGYEHAGYSNRVHLAGLTPLGSYTCPAGAEQYIYSLDLQNTREYNKTFRHRPSLPIWETLTHAVKNHNIFKQDNTVYIPL